MKTKEYSLKLFSRLMDFMNRGKSGPIIHAGMPRAGSTYLQTAFASSSNILYFHKDFELLSTKIGHVVLASKLFTKRLTLNKTVVFSHEGLGRSGKLKRLRYLLGSDVLLLYITRAPEAWFLSRYRHQIKKAVITLNYES